MSYLRKAIITNQLFTFRHSPHVHMQACKQPWSCVGFPTPLIQYTKCISAVLLDNITYIQTVIQINTYTYKQTRHNLVSSKVKVLLSQSQLWGQALPCHRISKECHIFLNDFYNTRQHYKYTVF